VRERIKALLQVLGSKVGLFLLLTMVIATSAGYVGIRWTHPELTRPKLQKHPVLGRFGRELTYVDEHLVEAKFSILQDKPGKFFDTAEGKFLTSAFFFDLARIRPSAPLYRIALKFLREAEEKHYDINRVLSLRYDILDEMLERRIAHHLVVSEMESMKESEVLKKRLARDAEFHRLQAHRYRNEENDKKAEEQIMQYFDLRRARGADARRLARFEVAKVRFELVRGTRRAFLRDSLAAVPSDPERMKNAVEMLKRAVRDLETVTEEGDDLDLFRRRYSTVWHEAAFMIIWSKLMLAKTKLYNPVTGVSANALSEKERQTALSEAVRGFKALADSPAASDWAPQSRLLRSEAQLILGQKVFGAIDTLDLLRKRLVDPAVAFASHLIYSEWLTDEHRNMEAHKLLKAANELRGRFPDAKLKYRDEIDLEAALRRAVSGLVSDAAGLTQKGRGAEEIEPYYLDAITAYEDLRELPHIKDVPESLIKYIFLEGEMREKLAALWSDENRNRSKESWVEAARRFEAIIQIRELRRKLSMARREALYRRAAEDYRKGGFNPGALAVYKKHLNEFRDSPHRSVVLLDVARTYRDLHDLDKAIEYFNRNITEFSADKRHPEGKNVPETKFELAQCLILRGKPEVKEGNKVVEKSDLRQAIDLLEGLLSHPNIDPRSSLWKRALYSLGIEYIKAGQRETGERKLMVALERFGTDPLALDAIDLLGEQFFAEKDYVRARKVFEKAQYIVLPPGDGLLTEKKLFAILSVGRCLLKEARYEEAIEAFQRTIREAGDRIVTVWAYSQMAAAYDAMAIEETDAAKKTELIRRTENARALGERRLQKLGDEAFRFYPKELNRKFYENLFRDGRYLVIPGTVGGP
jgi:tetratricopeptide (TPR) repeat protein